MNGAAERRARRMRKILTRECCPKCLIEPPQGFDCEIDQCPRELVEMRRSRRAWEFPEENNQKQGERK